MERVVQSRKNSLLLFVMLGYLPAFTHAQDYHLLYGLKGEWKFELGDDARRASPSFDDSKWEVIHVPAFWEDEGFPGYDGYAWYRKHFTADQSWKGKSLYLVLGRIDDVDEVYVNGKLVGGTGLFPPDYETAYNVDRVYYLSPLYLNIPGDNVIAVRVFDAELGGGIAQGKLGVYEDVNALTPDIPLADEWKFTTGDNLAWKEVRTDDSKWSGIVVPGFWEKQGFKDYDGYAWYRTTFRVPPAFAGKRLILLLGKIDDFDETYLNGELVGKTGMMGKKEVIGSQEYGHLRAYTISAEKLHANGENVLAVRVYDGFRDGGIYAGPIGFVTREKYLKWKDKSIKGWFDWIFK
jgi:sialate O-acetylesterase